MKINGTFPRNALLILLSLFVDCGRETTPAADGFGAFNERGGAHGGNDYSETASPPLTDLRAELLPELSGGVRAGPLSLDDGSSVVMCAGEMGQRPCVAMLLHTKTLWHISLPSGHLPLPGLAADAGRNVYVTASTGTLWAISPTGRLLWNRRLLDSAAPLVYTPSPPMALANGAIVGDSRGRLMRYDREGKMVWQVQRGGSVADRPCGDSSIGVVVALTRNTYALDDTLVILDPASGAQRWSVTVAGRILTAPAICGSRIVLCSGTLDSGGGRLPRVQVYGANGKLQWSAPLPLMPRGVACSKEGRIYVSCAGASRDQNGGAVVAFDQAGKRSWIVPLGTKVAAPVAVTSSLIYFVGRRHGETGIYSYSREGVFAAFVPVETLPDVSSRIGISSHGSVVLGGLDEPVLLFGN